MAEGKIQISHELRLKARARTIGKIIAQLYRNYYRLTLKNIRWRAQYNAERSVHDPTIRGGNAGGYPDAIRINLTDYPANKLDRRSDLDAVIAHEIAHYDKYSRNDLPLASAFSTYFSALGRQSNPVIDAEFKTKAFQRIERAFSPAGHINWPERGIKSLGQLEDYCDPNNDGYSYRNIGKELGTVAAASELLNGKMCSGLFIIREVSLGQEVSAAIRAAHRGEFEKERLALIRHNPHLKRIFRDSNLKPKKEQLEYARMRGKLKIRASRAKTQSTTRKK